MKQSNNNNNSVKYGVEKFEGTFEKEELGVTIIPNESINYIRNAEALGLYLYLLGRPTGWKLNIKQLKEHFQCNKDKIYKLLNYLMAEGFISKTSIREHGRFARNHYRVHLHRIINETQETQASNTISPCLDLPDVVITDTVNQDTYKTKNIENKEYNNTPIVPKGDEKSFSDFWNVYPVKKGRKKCEDKWKRLKLDLKAEVIITKLKTQIEQDDQWKRGFIPNPYTYINGALWEDEISQHPRNDAGSYRHGGNSIIEDLVE